MIRDMIIFFSVVTVVLFCLTCAVYFLEGRGCAAKSVSFKSSIYTFFGGCMVELDDGRFIPLKNYREIK